MFIIRRYQDFFVSWYKCKYLQGIWNTVWFMELRFCVALCKQKSCVKLDFAIIRLFYIVNLHHIVKVIIWYKLWYLLVSLLHWDLRFILVKIIVLKLFFLVKYPKENFDTEHVRLRKIHKATEIVLIEWMKLSFAVNIVFIEFYIQISRNNFIWTRRVGMEHH